MPTEQMKWTGFLHRNLVRESLWCPATSDEITQYKWEQNSDPVFRFSRKTKLKSTSFYLAQQALNITIQSTGVLGHEIFERVVIRVLRKVPLSTFKKPGG